MTVPEFKLGGAVLLAFVVALVALAAFPPQPIATTFGRCPPEVTSDP